MFGISHLLSFASTALSLTVFIGSLATIATSATITSIKVHSRRSINKKGKAKKITRLNAVKVVAKEKDEQKTKTANNVKVKQVVKNNAKTNHVVKSTRIKTRPQTAVKPQTKVQQPFSDKSNLIGEEYVSKEDLKQNSKFKWAYNIQLTSKIKPENNITLSWKTNDKDSIVDVFMKDARVANYSIINKDLTNVAIDTKYLNEKGHAENYSKKYSNDSNVVTIKQFRRDTKELFNKIVMTNESSKTQDVEQTL